MRIWNPYGMEGQQNGVAIYGSEGVMHIGRWASEGRRQHGYRSMTVSTSSPLKTTITRITTGTLETFSTASAPAKRPTQKLPSATLPHCTRT